MGVGKGISAGRGNAECRMQNAECRMQNAECRTSRRVVTLPGLVPLPREGGRDDVAGARRFGQGAVQNSGGGAVGRWHAARRPLPGTRGRRHALRYRLRHLRRVVAAGRHAGAPVRRGCRRAAPLTRASGWHTPPQRPVHLWRRSGGAPAHHRAHRRSGRRGRPSGRQSAPGARGLRCRPHPRRLPCPPHPPARRLRHHLAPRLAAVLGLGHRPRDRRP